ncbi:hypothetical protein BDV11DRAFT_93428 [Aspergillus similis]
MRHWALHCTVHLLSIMETAGTVSPLTQFIRPSLFLQVLDCGNQAVCLKSCWWIFSHLMSQTFVISRHLNWLLWSVFGANTKSSTYIQQATV